MGKAYECNGCGKLLKETATAVATCNIVNKGNKSTGTFYAVLLFLPSEDIIREDSYEEELCMECMRKVVEGIGIFKGE